MQRLLMWTILWCTLNLRLIGHPQYCPPFVSPPMSYYGAPNFLPFKSVHMLWTIFLTLNYTIVLDLSLILKLYEYDCVTRMVIDHENYVRLMSNLMITRINSVWWSFSQNDIWLRRLQQIGGTVVGILWGRTSILQKCYLDNKLDIMQFLQV